MADAWSPSLTLDVHHSPAPPPHTPAPQENSHPGRVEAMENHVSYPALASLAKSYPRAANSLFATYNDLLHAQRWEDLTVLDLPACTRGALSGRRPNSEPTTLYVLPCSMSESLSTSWLTDAFKALNDPEGIYLAISTEDSSIVYYKISRGFVKPAL